MPPKSTDFPQWGSDWQKILCLELEDKVQDVRLNLHGQKGIETKVVASVLAKL
jgi:hypothetical protein